VNTRTVVAVLGATLLASVVAGWLISEADDEHVDDEVVIESAGVYDEPGGGIPTAPELAGDSLPDVDVRSIDGSTLSLADLAGQPLVVNLWFSTCAPCKAEIPAFAEVHAELGDSVRFVGLNVQDSADRAARFADELGVTYEVLLDPDQNVPIALDIAQFPSTLFVSPDGHIVSLHQGALDADELRSAIAETLTST
jgi:cytochrome c biogenesis protein CcmG, thiol:disulfide interchange protein DsbE